MSLNWFKHNGFFFYTNISYFIFFQFVLILKIFAYVFNKIKNTKYLNFFFFFFFDKPNVTVVYCLILKRFVTCFAFWWWIRVFKTIQNKFYFQSTFFVLLFTIQIFLKILRGANSLFNAANSSSRRATRCVSVICSMVYKMWKTKMNFKARRETDVYIHDGFNYM